MSANVNRPTDIKKRDEDIARKLQFYGIFSAFQAGKVPSVGPKTAGEGQLFTGRLTLAE
jgi:hypothetical protein